MSNAPAPKIFTLDFKTIEAALVGWAKDVTNLECVIAPTPAPESEYAFVALQWLSISDVGDTWYGETYDPVKKELTRTLYGSKKAMLNVQVTTDSLNPDRSAMMYCDSLIGSLVLERFYDTYFQRKNMAVADNSDVRDLPPEQGGVPQPAKFLSRASFDLFLNLAYTRAGAEVVGTIEKVGLTGFTTSDSGLTATAATTIG